MSTVIGHAGRRKFSLCAAKEGLTLVMSTRSFRLHFDTVDIYPWETHVNGKFAVYCHSCRVGSCDCSTFGYFFFITTTSTLLFVLTQATFPKALKESSYTLFNEKDQEKDVFVCFEC